MLGILFCRDTNAPIGHHLDFQVGHRSALAALALFAILFLFPPLLYDTGNQAMRVFEAFYRSGALVFGGGHVVLPLLETAVVSPGWVSHEAFLAGYGATQAVPGPLFTFAAYLVQ